MCAMNNLAPSLRSENAKEEVTVTAEACILVHYFYFYFHDNPVPSHIPSHNWRVRIR